MSTLISGLRIFSGKSCERWSVRNPQKGEHIRVLRRLGLFTYMHHGIYVSDNEVIHFTGKKDGKISGKDNMVISTSLAEFLDGRTLEVKEYSGEERQFLNDPETIVNIARAHLGDRHYNLVFNNCEHFANLCTMNDKKSEQVNECVMLACNFMLAQVLFSLTGTFGGIC